MENKKWLIDVNEWDTFFGEHIYSRCFRNEYEQGYTDALDRVDDWMEEHPTVNAVEVAHGRWIRDGESIYCSACGFETSSMIPYVCDGEKWIPCYANKYCGNCGAKMTEVSNE